MTAADLLQALSLADAAATVREAAATLRQRWPGLRVQVVDAFDLRGEPVAAQGARHALYCAESDGHCWHLTADPVAAAALFIAEIDA